MNRRSSRFIASVIAIAAFVGFAPATQAQDAGLGTVLNAAEAKRAHGQMAAVHVDDLHGQIETRRRRVQADAERRGAEEARVVAGL